MTNLQKLIENGGLCHYTNLDKIIILSFQDAEKEKLAKIVRVLVEYMRKIEYVYDDGAHELVKIALQQAEKIVGE